MYEIGINMLETGLELVLNIIIIQYLEGKRLRELNYKALLYLAADMLCFWCIYTYELPEIWTMGTYLVSLLYILLTYKKGLAGSFWLLLRTIIFMLLLQIVCSLPFVSHAHVVVGGRLQGCFVNSLCIVLTIAIFAAVRHKRGIWERAVRLEWGKGIIFLLGLTVLYVILFYKRAGSLDQYEFIMSFFYVVTVIALVWLWQKMVLANHEKEKELEKMAMLEDTYADMVVALRGRQHEFNNHLSTLQSQHMLCRTYDELVAAQEKYIGEIVGSIQYYDLVHLNNPVLSGLLNLKLSKAEALGLQVSYKVEILAEELPVPTIELIEILGALLDNAMEYLQDKRDMERKIILTMSDRDGLAVTVANAIKKEDAAALSSFFGKGYSTKGEGRGYGLLNVRNLVHKNKGRLMADYREREEMLYLTVQFGMLQ